MQLELGLDPTDAVRLMRLPSITPLKTGRTRTRPVRIVWHDTPDYMLCEQGLALAEHRTEWRLERLRPDAEPWPPGAPPPVVEQARSRSLLTHALPETLLPAAAFEGHARSVALACDEGPVTLTVLDGVIRTVTAEHRACRVSLEGPEAAVLSLATRIAGEVRLAVPDCCLADAAIAMTRGVARQPRRHGAPALPGGLSVVTAFAHVAGHLTDVILHLAPSAANEQSGPEAVHQMRVAVRRLRSGIKVFRRVVGCPLVEAADAGLKVLAGRLAPTRDWDVFATETAVAVASAFPEDKRLRRLLNAADRRRRSCHADLRAYLQDAEFRRLGIVLAVLAAGGEWRSTLGEPERGERGADLRSYAASELNRRLKRLVKAGDDISALAPPALHALRLRAKRLRYAAEIFAPLYAGKATTRFIDRLTRLQNRLGTLNDGAVAASLLEELAGSGRSQAFAGGLVIGFVGAHGGKTRERIERAWRRLRHTSPFWD